MAGRQAKKSAFESMLDELDSDSSSSDDSDDEDRDSEDGDTSDDERHVAPSASSQVPHSQQRGALMSKAAQPKPPSQTSSSSPSYSSSSSSFNSTSYGAKQENSGPKIARAVSAVEREIANFGVSNTKSQRAQSKQETSYRPDPEEGISELKSWLFRPCAAGDPGYFCYVERERNLLGRPNNVYRCYMEGSKALERMIGHPPEMQVREPRFLLSAKKRSRNKTSNYLFSTEMNPSEDRGSSSVLGKLRGDAFGTRYHIVDGGLAPEVAVVPSSLRRELGVIQFEFDSGGPSFIEAWVPHVTSGGAMQVWHPANTLLQSGNVDMDKTIESGQWEGGLLRLVNVKPKWDEAHGGHVLNFQGRVTESSVKNFQLCCPELSKVSSSRTSYEHSVYSDVVLQFGKTGHDKFSMDVRYPLSIFTAFAICVSCLDGKMADRKGFELFRALGVAGGVVKAPAEAKGIGNPQSKDKRLSEEAVHVEGSMRGAAQIGGGISTTQYLRDKLSRVLK